MCKEAVVVYFERCPGICLQELRKTMTLLCPSRVTNRTPSEYRSRWACDSGELRLGHRVTTSLGSFCLHLQDEVHSLLFYICSFILWTVMWCITQFITCGVRLFQNRVLR